MQAVGSDPVGGPYQINKIKVALKEGTEVAGWLLIVLELRCAGGSFARRSSRVSWWCCSPRFLWECWFTTTPGDVIANGVRVAGVDLGGLKPIAARRRLDRQLAAGLQRPVRVSFGPRTFSMTGRQAGVTVDVNALVRKALARSRSGSIFCRALRDLFGGSANASIPAIVHFDHAAVTALISRARVVVDRPAQDATAQPNASRLLTSIRSHNGLVVDSSRLGAQVESSLTHAGGARSILLPLHVVRPRVTTSQLAARYPSYIVVDRDSFTLRLCQHLKLTRSYPIAVGMQALETPAGL